MQTQYVQFSYHGLATEENALIINTFAYRLDADLPDIDFAVRYAAITMIDDYLQAEFLDLLHESYSLRKAELVALDADVFAHIEKFAIAQPPGVTAGTPLTALAAAVLAKKSVIPLRTGRNRNYFSPISEGDTDGSYLTAQYMTKLNNFGSHLQTGILTAGPITVTPVVFSYVTGVGVEMVTAIARQRLGSQRRRLPGNGI